MTKVDRAQQLRKDPDVHYNCAQAAFIPFAEELGLTMEQANAIGAHFGGGMRVGATCGAVTGALMALGLMGKGEEEARAFWKDFKAETGSTVCAELKAMRQKGGMDCTGLVLKAVELVEKYS